MSFFKNFVKGFGQETLRRGMFWIQLWQFYVLRFTQLRTIVNIIVSPVVSRPIAF